MERYEIEILLRAYIERQDSNVAAKLKDVSCQIVDIVELAFEKEATRKLWDIDDDYLSNPPGCFQC